MKRVSLVVIERQDNKILCVSRGPRSRVWGLPGGQVNRGESFREAARRELWEETGLVCDKMVALGVYRGPEGPIAVYLVTRYSGQLRGSHEGRPGWRSWQVLFEGPYTDTSMEIYRDLKANRYFRA